jgi:hypothetical protein
MRLLAACASPGGEGIPEALINHAEVRNSADPFVPHGSERPREHIARPL